MHDRVKEGAQDLRPRSRERVHDVGLGSPLRVRNWGTVDDHATVGQVRSRDDVRDPVDDDRLVAAVGDEAAQGVRHRHRQARHVVDRLGSRSRAAAARSLSSVRGRAV